MLIGTPGTPVVSNYQNLADELRVSALRGQHEDLIRRIQAGDESAAEQASEMLEGHVTRVRTAYERAAAILKTPARDPATAVARLKALRTEAHEAASVMRILVVETKAGKAPTDGLG